MGHGCQFEREAPRARGYRTEVRRTGETTGRAVRRSGRGRRALARRLSQVLVAALVLVSTGAVGAAAGASVAAGGAGAGVASAVGTGTVGTGPVAQQGNGSGSDEVTICGRESSAFVGAFNGGIGDVPVFVRARLADSNVHLAVDGQGGGDYTMATDSDSRVTSASEGEPSSASVRVITDCETFRNITDASDPGSQFRTAYANDRVRFEGVGAVNWLFFAAVETATDPISLGVVLFLFLLLLVLVYVAVRRVSSQVRAGSEEAG